MRPDLPSRPGRVGRLHRECPVCDSSDLEYEFIIDGFPACSCRQCWLLFLNPQPPPADCPEAGTLTGDESGVYEIRAANAAARLAQLTRYARLDAGRLLLAGAGPEMESEARTRGFEAVSLSARDLDGPRLAEVPTGSIDACLLYCALEKAADPGTVLGEVRRALVPGGAVMVVAPTVDSRTARLFRSQWWEFNRANRFYFSTDTLQNLLVKNGYGDPIIAPDDTMVSLGYLEKRLSLLPPALRYRALRLALSTAPGFLRDRTFRFLRSRTAMLVRVKPARAVPRLSVIVPAFNEAATFGVMMDRLLAKTIEGVEIDVIVVEGASTDGTRDQVLRFRGDPRVRVILEDRPRGKGHAVRKGLEVADGDVILFQDADLEYDIDDYDALIEPILRHQRNFVIGSRHILKGGVWKVRRFNDAAGLAALFNLGHLVFLALFNLIYRQNLNDPFSMFKVFRRECLYGLRFESDRFDFDFEIVIKLLRKGYRPLELPVNYTARSFAEGKKVTILGDPLSWIRALVKFRYCSLYPPGNAR